MENGGKVFLVGAGPGAPELLTIKAYQLLKRCDVLIYDALVNPDIVELSSGHCERVFVGLPRTAERLPQAEVERFMVQRALAGKQVVRLKGGDPFIFGRGGEEAQACVAAGVEWEIVPGISAGHAVPAYAGIPLTHRDHASSVAFVTGHERRDKEDPVVWEKLATAVDTLVIFMSGQKLQHIVANLVRFGRDKDTPVALIESGTTCKQKTVIGTLNTILTMIEPDAIKSPALTVVGSVVTLSEQMAWFSCLLATNSSWFEFQESDYEVLSNIY